MNPLVKRISIKKFEDGWESTKKVPEVIQSGQSL
jgi:hypothetical protein